MVACETAKPGRVRKMLPYIAVCTYAVLICGSDWSCPGYPTAPWTAPCGSGPEPPPALRARSRWGGLCTTRTTPSEPVAAVMHPGTTPGLAGRRSLQPGSEHVRASTSWTYCNGDGYGGLGYELSYQTVDRRG